MTREALAFVVLLAVAACGRGDRASSTPAEAEQNEVPPIVETAVAVARGIDAAPTRADSVLAAHGLTAADLDSVMYEIAADSALRAAFAAERRQD